MGYLDNAGVARIWAKTKSLVTTSANSKITFQPATSLYLADAAASSQQLSAQQVIGDRVFADISLKTSRVFTAGQQIKFKNYWAPVTDFDTRALTYDSGTQLKVSVSAYTNSFYFIPATNINAGIWIRFQVNYRTTGVIHA